MLKKWTFERGELINKSQQNFYARLTLLSFLFYLFCFKQSCVADRVDAIVSRCLLLKSIIREAVYNMVK